MIQLSRVGKRFGRREALRAVSFSVRRGEVVGLLGHNGAGKSTTLRLIATILTPTEGRIEVLDPDVEITPDARHFKQRLGYLPDEPFLYPFLTGLEMLRFTASLYDVPHDAAEDRIRHYAAILEISESAKQLVSTLSRGTRRKVSLACALLHSPLYLLLDEPTESLDPVAIRVLKEIVSDYKRSNRAVLLSTHHLELAEALCDRVVILHRGVVVFHGTLGGLRRAAGAAASTLEEIYCRLFGSLADAGGAPRRGRGRDFPPTQLCI